MKIPRPILSICQPWFAIYLLKQRFYGYLSFIPPAVAGRLLQIGKQCVDIHYKESHDAFRCHKFDDNMQPAFTILNKLSTYRLTRNAPLSSAAVVTFAD